MCGWCCCLLPRVWKLEEENRRLQQSVEPPNERLECKICFASSLQVAFLPCGHVATCVQCGARFDRCPLCKEVVLDRARLFFA